MKVLVNQSGYTINQEIDGAIIMKSYLKGSPLLKLSLPEDISIGEGQSRHGLIQLDDCNFDAIVDTSEFDINRTLKIKPPNGEFTVMNYRITSDFAIPFKVIPYID